MEMFRLYLLNLIKSGESSKKKIVSKGLPARTEFDRRTYERFNTKDKHMMLMNEQDIFFIRDISKRGFNVEVSDRAFDRLTVGDKYKCRRCGRTSSRADQPSRCTIYKCIRVQRRRMRQRRTPGIVFPTALPQCATHAIVTQPHDVSPASLYYSGKMGLEGK